MDNRDRLTIEDIRLATEFKMVHKALMNKFNEQNPCESIGECIDINRKLNLDPGNPIGGLIFFYNKTINATN